MSELLLHALSDTFSVSSLLMVTTGILLGMVAGAIPGISATMAVAVLLPFTFGLAPVPGLMLLLGVYGSALYSGAIPAILLNVPGTPGAAATTIDGYPMAKQGKAGTALSVSLVTSGVGGIFAVVLVSLLTPYLSDFALSIGPADMFAVCLFSVLIIVSVSKGRMIKGLVSAAIGICIAMVGQDPIEGTNRLTFGMPVLISGTNFIAVMIGLFGVSEALVQYERLHKARGLVHTAAFGKVALSVKEWLHLLPSTLYSSVIGFIIGVLPGTGGTIASFVAYNEVRRVSTHRERFGSGDPRGVGATESANHASMAGALAPMLTLGIPGDAVSAILIGALRIQGIVPGPRLFTENASLVYSLFIGLVVVYALTVVIGFLGIRIWAQVLRVPARLLWPLILVLCVVGTYGIRSNVLDVYMMIGTGILGFFLMKGQFPIIPLIVGLILEPIIEESLRQALIISNGSWVFLTQPVSLIMLSLIALSFIGRAWIIMRERRRQRQGV